MIKFINFIGIDEQQLVGHNVIVVIVYSIWMIVKRIVISVLNLVIALVSYSFANIFNMFETLNTIFTSSIIVVSIIVLPIMLNHELEADNPDLLYNVNKVAYYTEKSSFYMAMSVYCLCFRLLKLPQFSLLANMPFATLI